jgi:hypothetical protein
METGSGRLRLGNDWVCRAKLAMRRNVSAFKQARLHLVEVKEKNPKIVWEDDPSVQTAPDVNSMMADRGEERIQVPYTASDVAAGLDPFKNARNRVRTGRFDIKENSELDRMFQPTYPVPEWS